jgi:hypothetical protein
MKKFHPIYLVYLIIIGMMITSIVGIRRLGPDGEQAYSLTKGIGHLSLEHPVRLPVKTVQFSEDGNFTEIDIYGRYDPWNHTRTRIWVTITRDQMGALTPEPFLEGALGTATSLPGFRLIDRSPATVDGIIGEQITYSNTMYRTDYETKVLHFHPYTSVSRQIFLVRDGSLWMISFAANEIVANTEIVNFQQVLASFKFLD